MSIPVTEAFTRERYVYFIHGADKIKIGCASDPESRLRSLQCGSPVPLTIIALMRGSRRDERSLHRRFCHIRSHGEWYHPADELLDHIAKVANYDIRCISTINGLRGAYDINVMARAGTLR